MNRIDVKKFGLSFGLTGALLYFGCILVMATVGRDGTVAFFNSLLHGQLPGDQCSRSKTINSHG